MAVVIPNAAEVIWLANIVGKTASATPLVLKLFSNNLTLANSTVAADFTVVAGGGYANLTLTAGSWSTTPGSPSSITHPSHIFTFTGPTSAPGTIWGYFIVDNNGVIWAAEKRVAAFTPAVSGDTLTVTPAITMASGTSD